METKEVVVNVSLELHIRVPVTYTNKQVDDIMGFGSNMQITYDDKNVKGEWYKSKLTSIK
jgi:hypothetical protein